MLIEKENKNDNLIEKKLDELSNENIKAQRYFSEDQKQEKGKIINQKKKLFIKI